MAEDAVAYVSVVPESSGVGASIARQFDGAGVGEQMSSSVSKGFLSTVGGIGLGLVKVVGGAVAVSGGLIATLALKGGISRALDIQDAEAKLVGLGHSAADITEIMGDALDSVKGTAFGLDKAATVAASAVAAGIQPGKDLTQYLKNVADASTIAGVSLDSMGDIFNTVQAGNKAYNQQLQQLSQQGIPIYQYLAKELGVTTDAVFDLASQGKISAAQFGQAIQDNIGGAALASGKTARGAWDNVLAALSRVGAAFTGPAIGAAPTLFTSIAGAVDRASAALTPYIGQLNDWLVPAIASLAHWIDGLDFTAIVTKVAAVFSAIKDTLSGSTTAISSVDLGGLFTSVLEVVRPLTPIFIAVAKGLGTIAGSIGQLIGAGIGILPPIIDAMAGALGFLKDNSGLIAPLLITIVGALLLYKASQIASNVAALASIPAYAARTAVLAASIPATLSSAAATDVSTAAVEGSKLALIQSAAAWIASKAATVAGAVATGIATAAQWLFNAAMDANPIGLIILAIAALIAIIILVVANWQTIVDFLTTVWNAVLAWAVSVLQSFAGFFMSIWNGIVAFFTGIWTGVSDFFMGIWNGIVTFVTVYINTVMAIIQAVGSAISGVWSGIWNGIVGFFTGAWNNIMGVLNTIGSAFGNAFGAVSGIVSGAFNGIVGVIRGAINSVIDLVNGAIGAINDTVGAAGAAFGVNIKIGKIPRLANGALINPTPGGSLVTVGEGRYPEAVVPMSPKILDQLGGGDGSKEQTVNNWNISEVQSAQAVAIAVARRQALLGA